MRNNQAKPGINWAEIEAKFNNGQSAYLIPASVDVNNFNEVFIWCDQFSVSLGSAKIK